MVSPDDLKIIFDHSNSIHENETVFQTTLKVAFYEVARREKFEEEVNSFLEKFEISGSTLWHWMQGTSVPHPNIKHLVETWCDKQIKMHLCCIPVIIDKCGEYTAYCSYCHETLVSNNEGKSWSLLKEIQPDHPNTKAAFEIALRNDRASVENA